MLPHIKGPNTRPLLCAPDFQNSSPWSIDHKELSHSAWTMCISKWRIINLLSLPLMKVFYSLYPTNFCITVSFVRKDRFFSVQKFRCDQDLNRASLANTQTPVKNWTIHLEPIRTPLCCSAFRGNKFF